MTIKYPKAKHRIAEKKLFTCKESEMMTTNRQEWRSKVTTLLVHPHQQAVTGVQ